MISTLALVWLAAPAATAEPESPAPADAPRVDPADLDRDLDEVQSLIRRGEYREALRVLEVILAVSPGHPWADAYRRLCEAQLTREEPVPRLSRDELRALKRRLHEESLRQRESAAQRREMDRRIRREQAQWDEELSELRVEAEREQARARREAAQARAEAEREAVRRARAAEAATPRRVAGVDDRRAAGVDSRRAEGVDIRRAAKAPEPAREDREAVPAPPEAAAHGSTPAGEVSRRDAAPEASARADAVPAPEPAIPSAELPEPGAVEIVADRLTVSPDRRIATAEGNVEVTSGGAVLWCDHMTLFTDTHDVYATGHVRLEDGGQVFRGEMVHYNFDTRRGRFLQGTAAAPPWYEHGRIVEHLADGVFDVRAGYITSCDLEPPHYRLQGRRATVFTEERMARAKGVTLRVGDIPAGYVPWVTLADRQSPFFVIPGERKPWGLFLLTGYRHELPSLGADGAQRGTVRLDWREHFGFGGGADYELQSETLGDALLRVYYNPGGNEEEPDAALPKGADADRYRVLWRHRWAPDNATSVVTDIQKYSDANFRKDFVFREEFIEDDHPSSFVSMVRYTPEFTLSGLLQKRLNRFETVTDALPQVTLAVREQRVGESNLFSRTSFDAANLQTKRAHSTDDDAMRLDWLQELSYALGWFRPVEVTPRVGIRQTYFNKDAQGSGRDGARDVFSGQFSAGADASLKLFRVFDTDTDAAGLNLNRLRHVLTPTLGYRYVHEPTVPNGLLNFALAEAPTNQLAIGVENKLQTKRPGAGGTLVNVELARFLVSVPYLFRGSGNSGGGGLGDWLMDLELYPWPWLRFESDLAVPSRPAPGRDGIVNTWNVDVVMVGGEGVPSAHEAPDIRAPEPVGFQAGPQQTLSLLPKGQWYLGFGHRYAQNDKTEDVVQFDWRFADKWQMTSFHRITWKEVAGGAKRFDFLREYQYGLVRDLHDWIAELVYRVDRDFGQEVFLTLTLKAYPRTPIELETSYRQPKATIERNPFVTASP